MQLVLLGTYTLGVQVSPSVGTLVWDLGRRGALNWSMVLCAGVICTDYAGPGMLHEVPTVLNIPRAKVDFTQPAKPASQPVRLEPSLVDRKIPPCIQVSDTSGSVLFCSVAGLLAQLAAGFCCKKRRTRPKPSYQGPGHLDGGWTGMTGLAKVLYSRRPRDLN
jgi:hypothetical protein